MVNHRHTTETGWTLDRALRDVILDGLHLFAYDLGLICYGLRQMFKVRLKVGENPPNSSL